MVNLFLQILEMSLTASYCIIFVCIARLLLKKAPKIYSYVLWSVVAFRLICPIAIESSFSMVNTRALPNFVYNVDNISVDFSQTYTDTNMAATSNANPDSRRIDVDEIMEEAATSGESGAGVTGSLDISSRSDSFLQNGMISSQGITIFSSIWAIIACLLVVYGISSYIRFKQKVHSHAQQSTAYQSVAVWQVHGLDTPFVLGFRHPAIYLPEDMKELDRLQCLAHEYTHIRRRDYLIKQLAHFLVCIHWFNPLVWLGFYLMTADMEMSCDEAALQSTSLDDRKRYCGTLLDMSVANKVFNGYPPAFGSNSTKTRIKNIMNYRQPKWWMLLASLILVILCIAVLATNSMGEQSGKMYHYNDFTNDMAELVIDATNATSDEQELLDSYAAYLNLPENNAFVTTIYNGNAVDLDMLFYDAASMLNSAPLADGEADLLMAENNLTEQDILYHLNTDNHFTGTQIDELLLEKMNLTMEDIAYTEKEKNTLKTRWTYLEEYDTYTMPLNGDCKLQDMICTKIMELYNGIIILEYRAAEKNAWIKSGKLIMKPKSAESKLENPGDYYFYYNYFTEGGYQDEAISPNLLLN